MYLWFLEYFYLDFIDYECIQNEISKKYASKYKHKPYTFLAITMTHVFNIFWTPNGNQIIFDGMTKKPFFKSYINFVGCQTFLLKFDIKSEVHYLRLYFALLDKCSLYILLIIGKGIFFLELIDHYLFLVKLYHFRSFLRPR